MTKSTKFAGIKINDFNPKIINIVDEAIMTGSYMTSMSNGSLPEDISKQILDDMPHLKNNLPEFAMVIRNETNDKRWGFFFKVGYTNIFFAPIEIIKSLKSKGFCK